MPSCHPAGDAANGELANARTESGSVGVEGTAPANGELATSECALFAIRRFAGFRSAHLAQGSPKSLMFRGSRAPP
jgi:hypothetical protein